MTKHKKTDDDAPAKDHEPQPTQGEPTDGPEAQKLREKRQRQEPAEGSRHPKG